MFEDDLKWPYLKTYFKQLSESDITEEKSNFTFKCMLCMPKIKLISTFISSDSNLKTHIKLKLSEVGKTVKNLSQTEFNKANLELIINTVSPFSLIEHPAFIKYCHLTLNKVPMSRSLMKKVHCSMIRFIN
ncbi:Hypothetical protein CINCED_3A025756 [Cinara cedri]|uniref:Uncharacterized protein n=1 Tax=Cinara cedri TaxID=506608 RepID=A0A5E4MQL7_9HEMI|nr:Hypothetical protein CINCED_3A025756 [Cinara cedri]